MSTKRAYSAYLSNEPANVPSYVHGFGASQLQQVRSVLDTLRSTPSHNSNRHIKKHLLRFLASDLQVRGPATFLSPTKRTKSRLPGAAPSSPPLANGSRLPPS
ncbi:hypothetical protein Ptr902_09031 [Pyrenophora tritici-repentis]|nr:hypothetical protein Ptr902_09031 [Pyrenophora tritici-repentis]